jgi:hypothetical protein
MVMKIQGIRTMIISEANGLIGFKKRRNKDTIQILSRGVSSRRNEHPTAK